MMDNQLLQAIRQLIKLTMGILALTLLLIIATVYLQTDPTAIVSQKTMAKTTPLDDDLIENGIHVRTGLKEGKSLTLVIQNCTACHSAKIIIQNRADKEGWKNMIKWMQETQNLWELGTNEEKIINYLAKNYPPQKKGRRTPLTDIEWYEHN